MSMTEEIKAKTPPQMLALIEKNAHAIENMSDDITPRSAHSGENAANSRKNQIMARNADVIAEILRF